MWFLLQVTEDTRCPSLIYRANYKNLLRLSLKYAFPKYVPLGSKRSHYAGFSPLCRKFKSSL